MNNPPFFIVGAPRSGTTLLAVMLNRHSQIFVGANAYGHQLAKLLPDIRSSMTTRQSFEKFDFEQQLIDAISKTPRLRLILETDKLKPLCNRICDSLNQLALAEGKQVFGDKCPPVIDFLDDLRTAIPNARFIHVIRDGRSVALSQKQRQNTHAVRAIHRWKKNVLQGELWQQVLNEKEFLTIQFEKLVQNPSDSLQGICRFLGVGYEKEMQDLGTNPSANAENAYVTPGMNSAKINTWEGANPRLLRRMELVAGDVLQRYGYDIKSDIDNSRIAALSKFQENWFELVDALKVLGQREVVVMREQKLVAEKRNLWERITRSIRAISRVLLSSSIRDFLTGKKRLF